MTRLAPVIVFLTAFILTGHAQAPARNVGARPAATASIRGRVIAAATRAPLRNARVHVTSAAGSVGSVLTDDDGGFVVSARAAGQYFLAATKAGYVATRFGAREIRDPGMPIAVADGRIVPLIELRMPRGAVVSGRIIDSLGDPIVGVPVTAEVLFADSASAVVATTVTDDLGEYRLGGLPAGKVVVAANMAPSVVGANGRTEMLPGPTRMLTYYPGVESLAEAQAIALAPGDEKASIDFLVLAAPPMMQPGDLPEGSSGADITSRGVIRGRVTHVDGRPLANAMVRLSDRNSRAIPPPATVTDDEGRYQFRDLSAGSYRVVATRPPFLSVGYGQRRATESGEPVELRLGESRDGIDIAMPGPGAIAGRIVDDDGDPVEGVIVRVLQIAYASGRRTLIDAVGDGVGRTDDLGRYRIYGLRPGEYVVAALLGPASPNESTADWAGYAPTYFPGTTAPGEAQLIRLDLAEQALGIDFALLRVAPGRVGR